MTDAPTPAPEASPGSDRRWLLGALAVVAAAVALLRHMGRPWWCACGELWPWISSAKSRHTSQHLFDPYSFTHFLHGFVFFALLWVVLRSRLRPRARLAIAIALEAGWELLENSSFVIERYRAKTVALDYYGDTILNSLSDILCCSLGFIVASRLPSRAAIVVFVGVELLLALTIRDNLTLNVVTLIFPLDAVKNWQLGQ